MKKFILTAALTVTAAAAHAQAQPQPYAEINTTIARLKPEGAGFSGTGSATLLRATLGYEFDPTWAAEGMLGFGVKNGSVSYTDTTGTTSVDAKVNKMYGIYLKPRILLTEGLEGYARLGYTKVDITAKASDGTQARGTSGSFSYGLGLGYSINPQLYVNADYMRYAKDLQGFSGGLGMKF
ncbi:outer membrane beta-barrel protein [Amphibiibacter pelophylacis]|uniref:Outer membrane beta-barrel protein n=1 Tax=Amphibiibacter pelophylacis TaxID=1799477 RepID=A0ACC6P1C9_9BURK